MADNNIFSRIKNGWNAFRNKNPTNSNSYSHYNTMSYYRNPNRISFGRGNDKSIISAFYNRIALDVSNVNIRHIRIDENGRYMSDINSGLNRCLSLEANIDQTGRELIKNAVFNMIEDGQTALVPTDTTSDPSISDDYDILKMRTGEIVEWYPDAVTCDVYNESTGKHEKIRLPKRNVAIIQNPFYSVMNEPNSVLKRLVRKLNLLDFIDEQVGSTKMNLIIQLPFSLKGESKQKQAEKRREDIEKQLVDSPYGITYIDNTEKVIQLNRSVDNNLLEQVKYLTEELYGQLGFSKSILDGTADEQTRFNYLSQIVEPYLNAIVEEIRRKFLKINHIDSYKGDSDEGFINETVDYFMNPLKLLPVSKIADVSDKLTRNEILSSNEIRQIIGFKPSEDPRADELLNKNMPQQNVLPDYNEPYEEPYDDTY